MLHWGQTGCTEAAGLWSYARNFSYNAAGPVKGVRLGNGRWETAVYNNRLQVTQIGLGETDSTQNLLKLEFSYGDATQNNGSMREQKVTVPAAGTSQGFIAIQSYEYDELNRIRTATETIGGNQTWKQTFVYDRYGNRRFDEPNTTTLPKECNGNTEVCEAVRPIFNPAINAANNRLSSAGLQYDAAGNLTVDGEGRQMLYDAENHLKEVRDSQSSVVGQYFYDGDGRRVKKISSTETTVFVYNASGKLVAEYSTDLAETQQVSYLTMDHLGSPRVITDQNGTVTSRKDFSAFGEETITPQRTQGLGYQPHNIRQDYTGYEKDTESGLEFAQARYYNLLHGRFTSVDPLTASAMIRNPQTFNRYSYVENSPISFKDPTGLFSNESVSAMARSRLEICWELGICGRAKLALEQRNARLESRSVCFLEEMGANTQAGSGCNKDCVKREKEKCYELGRDHFYENAIKYGVIDGLWFAGGVNTVYGMITGLSLWAVKRLAGFIGAGAGVIWGIRRAAIEGGEIEDECKKRIPEKCGKDCSG